MWPLKADVPYGLCRQLFELTPAVEPITGRMILAVGTETRRYFTLTRQGLENPKFVLSDWPGRRVVTIDSEGAAVNAGLDYSEVDQFLAWALHGTPIPRHGTVFGEVRGIRDKRVLSLLAFHSARPSQDPEVGIDFLINADLGPSSRPASYWWTWLSSGFWDEWQRGTIVDLAEHFRQRRETVWRTSVRRIGATVYAVAENITVGNVTLPQGRFVQASALRRRETIPPLDRLLAYQRKDDLFNTFAQAN